MGAIVAGVISAALVVAGVVAWSRWLRSRIERRRRVEQTAVGSQPAVRLGGRAVAVLDLEGAPLDSPALQRLVGERAADVFVSMPEVNQVDVRTPTGAVLGTRSRAPVAGSVPVPIPTGRGRHPAPDVSRHLGESPHATMPEQHWEDAPAATARHRRFIERFEVPDRASALVSDGQDPVDVVRSILAAAGHRPVVDGDTIVVDGCAFVVLFPKDGVIAPEALGHAFLRVEASDAASGVVIMLGFADPEDVRHREVVAPHVVHVGARAIQRMADAVALGADPVPFAVLSTEARGRHELAIA